MRIAIAGGGTGGHLYPGIALAREFQRARAGCEILFIGTRAGIEARVVPTEGFRLETIRAKGIVGKGWKALSGFALLPAGWLDSRRILKRFGPGLVVGVGGYASGPVLAAAASLGIPTMILEQNVVPGRTNRLLARWVDRVVTAFEESRPYFPGGVVEVIGNPVRREICRVGSPSPGERLRILVFGGSQGARAINRAVIGSLSLLEKKKSGFISVIKQGRRTSSPFGTPTVCMALRPTCPDISMIWRQPIGRPIWS